MHFIIGSHKIGRNAAIYVLLCRCLCCCYSCSPLSPLTNQPPILVKTATPKYPELFLAFFPFYTKKSLVYVCVIVRALLLYDMHVCMCVSIFISTYSASAFPTWSLNWMQPTTIVLIFLEKQKRKLHVLIHFPFAFNLPTSPRRRQTKIAAARRLKHRACNGVNMFCLANTQAHTATPHRGITHKLEIERDKVENV